MPAATPCITAADAEEWRILPLRMARSSAHEKATPMSDNGLITLQRALDFATTLERFVSALEERDVTIFMRVDHAANAASVDRKLRPTTLVIFGSPAAGTALMQARQTAGIDLPMKALVWEDADGTVKLTYNDPAWISTRHGLSHDADLAVVGLTAVLSALARHATSLA
jgi:uncharacterized protein (DUF302 family)